MQKEIIFSGFGGQGVLFAGQLLAYTAMDEGYEVTWYPSYGPEMRGGTANCTVIISDEEIGAPAIKFPMAAVVMNLPSLDKYEPLVKPGGYLIINESMVDRKAEREDIHIVSLPGNEIADELGSGRVANLVMLGALLANMNPFPFGAVEKSLQIHIPDRHKSFIPLNLKALEKGSEFKA